MQLDFDPTNFRDWMAGVGLLRILSETTDAQMVWRFDGRYRLHIEDAPNDLAARCSAWVTDNRHAWAFDGAKNVNFDAQYWRNHAGASNGIESALWCALGSDGVMHKSGKHIQASKLEYGHGGGHQHWLGSMRVFMAGRVSEPDFARILGGERDERMTLKVKAVCRWDAASDRAHAYRDRNPAGQSQTQDQTINALAAIGMASCPSAPGRSGLRTPLVTKDGIQWPVWTVPLRIADLEAALCCGWSWPSVMGRRWIQGQLYCFGAGELREPEMSPFYPGGSRAKK